ncbi:MAG TPA: hypothetical protein VGG25_02765 [Streptosporangiaceae bacterium]|jgi:hypothetical protein
MAVKITVTLDEERQRQSGAAEQAAEEIMALLTAMKDDGRLSIQSRNYWVPVRDMKVHTGLPAVAAQGRGVPRSHRPPRRYSPRFSPGKLPRLAHSCLRSSGA